jgi:hypothetical protein
VDAVESRKRINISSVLAGQKLGIKEVDDGIWLASFMRYDLGYFDLEPPTSRQPVRHEVVTHVLGTTCHLCVQAGQATVTTSTASKNSSGSSGWRGTSGWNGRTLPIATGRVRRRETQKGSVQNLSHI